MRAPLSGPYPIVASPDPIGADEDVHGVAEGGKGAPTLTSHGAKRHR